MNQRYDYNNCLLQATRIMTNFGAEIFSLLFNSENKECFLHYFNHALQASKKANCLKDNPKWRSWLH